MYKKIITHLFQCDRCNADLNYQESAGEVQAIGNITKNLSFYLTLKTSFKQRKDLLFCETCTLDFNEFLGDV